MANKLSAAQKQKISDGVKRARAAKLAKSSSTVNIEPFRTDIPSLTPRSSREEALQLASDVVTLVVADVPPDIVVRVVERILRP